MNNYNHSSDNLLGIVLIIAEIEWIIWNIWNYIETTLKSQLNVEHCQIHLPTDELSSAHKLYDDQDEPLKPVTKITFLSGVPDELRGFFKVNHWGSIVMIPIAKNSRHGFVSFASSNPNKYTAETDTEFLEKIGIVVTELLIPGN